MNAYMDMKVDFPAGFEAALAKWIEHKCFCEKGVSLADLSELTGVEPAELSHYLIVITGMRFREWRNRLRIEEAKKILIEDEEISAQLVAECVGFTDRSNFHRAFVDNVGCTPTQWRISGGNPSGF